MLFLFFCTDLHFGGRISFVWCFWILAMPLGWSPLRRLVCGEAVAFSIPQVRFIGLDVHKKKIAVAIAEEDRNGEVLSYGSIDNTDPNGSWT
jgi:hypothetical protein